MVDMWAITFQSLRNINHDIHRHRLA